MRIIAGEARSVPLITPEGLETRPTSDQIKETLFNMMQMYTAGSVFLDLFAGSGQIGCEALSRGAKRAVFVDQGNEPIRCIKHNVEKIKMADRALILKQEAVSGIRTCEAEGIVFDIIFMDPPYEKEMERGILEYLKTSSICTSETLIIIEASKKTDFTYLDILGYDVIKDKLYKNNRHLFIQKKD
jgi:16S rRNA (guanine966-N2)-methyltransferase